MVNPNEGRFEEISPELAKRFSLPEEQLTPTERVQREWTRFQEGEEVTVKGTRFIIHEIGESRLVLKPIPQN